MKANSLHAQNAKTNEQEQPWLCTNESAITVAAECLTAPRSAQAQPLQLAESGQDRSRAHTQKTSFQNTGNRCAAALLSFVLLCCTSCSAPKEAAEFGQPRNIPTTQTSVPSSTAEQDPGEDQVLQAQASGAQKTEILFSAPVYKLLPDDRNGIPHQRFLLQLSNGTTVLVAHNTKMAPQVPIKRGDRVIIKGEFIANARGGVVHWTHHTDTPRHQGGYILFNGQKYQ